jgi:hypothetical protein
VSKRQATHGRLPRLTLGEISGRNLDTEAARSLVGLFLADGRLCKVPGPTRPQIRAVLEGGVGEIDFLQEKVDELLRALPRKAGKSQSPEIRPYQTSTRDSGNTTTVLRFRMCDTRLHLIYNLLYPAGRRQITTQALDLLGGRAAAWLWAEGARPGKDGWTLKRAGDTEAEAALLASWLRLLTGAEADVIKPGARPRLRLDAPQAALAQSALLPYAPVSRRHLFVPAP